ncbi:MAG TPA: type II secretion system F family protein [Acidobacteriaceae bacterium]|jgi:tight adherence protein B|nr:type II secretion system F family protein [Acidobacteriaceae bacterium]
MFLLVAFGSILLVTFGVVTFMTGASRQQKIVERRVAGLVATSAEGGPITPQVQLLLKTEPTGNYSFLNALMQDYALPRAIQVKIIQADMEATALTVVLSSLGLAAAGFGIAYLWAPIIAVQAVAALALAYAPYGFIAFKAARRMKKFNDGLPDSIDMMSRALRAGHSMTASINVIAEQAAEPVRSEFSEVFKQQNFGLPIRDAMGQMLERVPSQDLRVLVTAILVQKETGGNLVEILDRTAYTIRERLRIHGEIRTHTAQGRMTGYILCALPIVMLVVINWMNPGYSKVLTDTPTGHMISYVGIGLLITGGLIIRHIINGIEV